MIVPFCIRLTKVQINAGDIYVEVVCFLRTEQFDKFLQYLLSESL
jgi:hypothetical protein